MFGMGPKYADLLRPEDALRKDIYEREKRIEEYELNDLQGNNNSDLSSGKKCSVKYIMKNFSAAEDEESQNLTDVQKEWKKIFHRLDKSDGTSDGKIDRKALIKWVSALDLQKTIELEADLNISPRLDLKIPNRIPKPYALRFSFFVRSRKLERLVSRADHDKDGYVDEEEFLNLISNEDEALSKKQQSVLHQYLKVAAYAEEYHWCPPPFFILVLTIVQIGIYVYHVVHFKKFHENLAITWSGPEPICSKMIYDPRQEKRRGRFFVQALKYFFLLIVFDTNGGASSATAWFTPECSTFCSTWSCSYLLDCHWK